MCMLDSNNLLIVDVISAIPILQISQSITAFCVIHHFTSAYNNYLNFNGKYSSD